EFFKDRKSQIEKEAKIAYKRDLNITTKIEPIVTTPSRKVILKLLECGTTNYEIEEFIENRHKEVIVKEVIDSSVQDEKNPMMISFGEDIPSPILQKSEIYNFTLWDIPKEVQANRIRLYVQLTSRATSRIEVFKKTLAIHFEGGKTVHISSVDIRHQRLERTAHQKELNGNRAVETQKNKNQQERMIKSLLNKPFRKVTIDKYISKNGLNNEIVLDPKEVKTK
ncbi:24343_t:CDS:2, partial [Gigaspora margarita]